MWVDLSQARFSQKLFSYTESKDLHLAGARTSKVDGLYKREIETQSEVHRSCKLPHNDRSHGVHDRRLQAQSETSSKLIRPTPPLPIRPASSKLFAVRSKKCQQLIRTYRESESELLAAARGWGEIELRAVAGDPVIRLQRGFGKA